MRLITLVLATVYWTVSGCTFAYLALAAGPQIGQAFTWLTWFLVGFCAIVPLMIANAQRVPR